MEEPEVESRMASQTLRVDAKTSQRIETKP